VLVVGQRSPTQATAGTKDNTPLVETPQSITVFDRAELDQLNIADLDQALRYVPGAAPDTRGASGSR
jgi:iron complex outermembrane receptor protein